MTPEEAENFYEEDEPAEEVFAAFDTDVHGRTARPVSDSESKKPPPVTRDCLLCSTPIPPGWPVIYISLPPPDGPRIGHALITDCKKRKVRK